MKSIKDEYRELQKRYDLSNIELYISRQVEIEGMAFYVWSWPQRMKRHETPLIVLRDYRVRQSTLRVLLHEICHAIQDREGRLKIPRTHSRQSYALEVEAESFSLAEYRKLYGEKYGKIRTRWWLASYDYYTAYYQNSNLKGINREMTNDELVGFVHSLEGRFKRPIVKCFDRNKTANGNWDHAISRLAV